MSDRTIVESARLIRPLSVYAKAVVSFAAEKDRETSELLELISCDPVVTCNVLKAANDPTLAIIASRSTIEINSQEEAFQILGERLFWGIAIGCCYQQTFEKNAEEDREVIWKHSLLTAIAARELAKFSTRPIKPSIAFTAGIVHNIGKLILSDYLKNVSKHTIRDLQLGNVPNFLAIEKSISGTDHTEVGGVISVLWNLPGQLTDVMLYHHFPQAALDENKHLAYLIHVSDFVAMMQGVGQSLDSFKYELHKDYKQYVSLSIRQFDKVFFSVSEEFMRISRAIFPLQESKT